MTIRAGDRVYGQRRVPEASAANLSRATFDGQPNEEAPPDLSVPAGDYRSPASRANAFVLATRGDRADILIYEPHGQRIERNVPIVNPDDDEFVAEDWFATSPDIPTADGRTFAPVSFDVDTDEVLLRSHGYIEGDTVVFIGRVPPRGVFLKRAYVVRNVDVGGNKFQIAASLTGAIIDIGEGDVNVECAPAGADSPPAPEPPVPE